MGIKPCSNEALAFNYSWKIWGRENLNRQKFIHTQEYNFPEQELNFKYIHSCVIRTSLEDNNGVIFNVNINETDLMAGIHLIQRPNLGTILAGDTAFEVKKGTQFYYRYNDSLLTCSLSK